MAYEKFDVIENKATSMEYMVVHKDPVVLMDRVLNLYLYPEVQKGGLKKAKAPYQMPHMFVEYMKENFGHIEVNLKEFLAFRNK